MRFGVVSAYLGDDWHSRRIVEACTRHGSVDAFRPTDFGLSVGRRRALVTARGRDVRAWDVWLLPRALGEEGDHEFQCTVYKAIADVGVPVVNTVSALLTAQDKAHTSWLLARASVPTPEVRAVQSEEEAVLALRDMGCVVAKPPYGSLGIGVVRVAAGQRAGRTILRGLLAKYGVVYLQRFVVARHEGHEDIRVFVVGERACAAMLRRAPPGEFVTNVHRGATTLPLRATPPVARLAVDAVRALGLAYGGVDIVMARNGPSVLEVNGAPRWEGILHCTGHDMAEAIVTHAASLPR